MAFTAKVSGGAGVPTGTVQLQVDGADVGGPVALNAQGAARFDPPSFVDVGSTITARYAGDGVYGPSRGDIQPLVQQAHTATSLTSAASPPPHAGDVTFTATVDNVDTGVIPFGSVQFFIDGQPVTDLRPLDDNGQVGIANSNHPPGDYVVTAVYHDDTAAIADFADSQASLTEHVEVPAPPAPAGPAPPAPPVSPTPAPATPPAGPARVTVVGGRHPTVKLSRGRFALDTDEQALCPAGAQVCTVTVVGTAAVKRTASRPTITVVRATFTIRPGHHAALVATLDSTGTRLLRARKRLVIRTRPRRASATRLPARSSRI